MIMKKIIKLLVARVVGLNECFSCINATISGATRNGKTI